MKRALFIAGGWQGHRPRECCELVAGRLRDAGFGTEIVETLDVLTDASALGNVNVIVPCWTLGAISGPQEQGLLNAVRAGTGLAGWHGGMCDAFRNNTEYQFATGGQFVAHPGGQVDYTVHVTDMGHAIMRGLPADFPVHSEQYYMHVDPSNSVLAETRFSGQHAGWIDGVRIPVVWTRSYDKGRVFFCSVGHGPEALGAQPVIEIVTRGIRWAARDLDEAAVAPVP